MTAIRRRDVASAIDRFPRQAEAAVSKVVREIVPGVFRLPLPPKLQPDEQRELATPEVSEALPASFPPIPAGEPIPTIAPGTVRQDVPVATSEPDDLWDDAPAPYAWVGMLICAATSIVTISAIVVAVVLI